MQINFEQAKELIAALPPEDFARFDKWFAAQKQQTEQVQAAKLKHDLEKYRRAKEWLRANEAEYMNQWVCLEGNELIGHGADANEVHRIAKERGIEAPFLHHLVEEKHPFGGW